MPLITVSARVASTHPVEKYGDWRLSAEALEQFAERLQTGAIPMLFDHRAHEVIAARVTAAAVVPLEDGNYALDATFEVDADEWKEVQDRFDQAGVRGGMSFSATAPQTPSSSGEQALVTIAADAAAWTDEDRDEARAALDALVPTESARLFQYSAVVEVATVVLVIAKEVGLGLLGSAAWAAVANLVRRRGRGETRIEIHREQPDGAVVKALVTTSDPDVALAALKALPPAQSAPTVQYDAPKRLWLDH